MLNRWALIYFYRCVRHRRLFIVFIMSMFILACNHLNTPHKANNIPCEVTGKLRVAPHSLSASCLYSDKILRLISSQLIKFTPNYQLWSDGSNKSRWIYLPPHTQINTTNPDRWIFPVGTQIFKEFRQVTKDSSQEIKVETRHLQKITPGSGEDSWLISTYQWNEAQSEASLSMGASNVLNTDHDIPSQQDCIDCHKGNTDFILGFEAIQLSDKQAKYAFGYGPKRQLEEWTLQRLLDENKLTVPMEVPVLPGSPIEQKALGYLHANCGNCHNELGHAAEEEAGHLVFRHQLSFNTLNKTDVYQTAVNKKTRNFTAVPFIALGASEDELAIYQSALYLRMNSTDEEYRMPMLAREKIDYQALSIIHRWLRTIDTPQYITFNKGDRKSKSHVTDENYAERSAALPGQALQLEIQFFNNQFIPDVMALYWPEDSSLAASPIMDHQEGYFTNKLILGNKGSQMSLRNSDEVGHTIYVKDKKQKIRWQLNYMPPGSVFSQELYWDNDIFVEMKCRLHLYMSAWVGSISSKYYKIVELNQQPYKVISMDNYPEEFSQLNIWLPKYGLITTSIKPGQEQSFELNLGGELLGKIRIKRTVK